MDGLRGVIHRKLHETYALRAYDNQDVWAGNVAAEVDGVRFGPTMARAFLGAGQPAPTARIRVELYLRDVPPERVVAGDLDARLWTDINERGFVDQRGVHRNGLGRNLPMRLVVDERGRGLPSGNNLVYESDPISIEKTGVFHYTVGFSADDRALPEPSKSWILINDISFNRDGVIVVSPEGIRRCPSLTEICARKAGAKIEGDTFWSGTFREVTRLLDATSSDLVYLLPFFEPGFGDVFTGKDVRKGELGSVYAVRDFFRIAPELATPPEEADFRRLVSEGLVRTADMEDLLDGRQLARLRGVEGLLHFRTYEALSAELGRDALTQLVGRAELRALTRRAHDLGKRVIFDLVLMQTSRDCPLIGRHPEWYVRDEDGRPRIHQIAWLVYSDVALLDLPFNKPLQNYLSAVAPFWIHACDLDGVRIDASQTVDRPFLKQIKNRINEIKPDAIVLGETLCALEEAADVPTDMIYALLVDSHRDADRARPYTEFLERMFGTFAPRTVAVGYFENHDSPRATRIWRNHYDGLLKAGAPKALAVWRERAGAHDPAVVMSLLRNLQASLIDATAGSALNTNLAYGLEFGSAWGEEERTDFEHRTVYGLGENLTPPHLHLARAYETFHRLRGGLPELWEGHIYFHRNEFEGGDPDDRVLAYTRVARESSLLVAHNLDPLQARKVTCRAEDSGDGTLPGGEMLFDTYSCVMGAPTDGTVAVSGQVIRVRLEPLQSILYRLPHGAPQGG